MSLKRLLAIAPAFSVVVLAGALAVGAVTGIGDEVRKTGTYSPVDPSRSGRGGASNLPVNNGEVKDASTPGLETNVSAASPTLSTPTHNPSTPTTRAKPTTSGPAASAHGGATRVSPGTETAAPATTTTSFDDSGDDSGDDSDDSDSDDPLIDD